MPISGVSWRSQQFSLLAKYLHDRQTSQQFEDLLIEARLEYQENCRSGRFNKNSLFSSEAAVKYYILGAISSGFLLFVKHHQMMMLEAQLNFLQNLCIYFHQNK